MLPEEIMGAVEAKKKTRLQVVDGAGKGRRWHFSKGGGGEVGLGTGAIMMEVVEGPRSSRWRADGMQS
jgi:hypothetical protein